jgi:NADP-dependent 3-hydroxy acid dehydrogenase YdfG
MTGFDALTRSLRLDGKRALVTGASSGFGAHFAQLLASAGAEVVLAARRTDKLQSLADSLRAQGTKVSAVALDVSYKDSVHACFEQIGACDIVINNAGVTVTRALLDQTEDDWDSVIDTNLKGLLYVTRAVAQTMVARGQGHIINIGSLAGREAYPGGNVYGASKFAVDGLTDGMRLDLTPKGIKVSQIAPGLADTEFSTVRFHGDRAKADSVYSGMQPLSPEDVAEVIGYVASAPNHINLADVLLMPAAQASSTLVRRS